MVVESPFVPYFIQNSYRYGDFNLTLNDVRTNTPTMTPCRAPTSTQCHAWAETLMEHIATNIGADPLDFRIANLLHTGDLLYTFNANDDTIEYAGPNPVPDMIDL